MSYKVPGKTIAAVLGLLIFAFVLSYVDIGSVLSIISSVDLALLAASFVLLFFLLFLKGVKWRHILLSQGTAISTLRSSKYFCIGFMFSTFTPGRVGDLVRAFYVRRQSGLSAAISSVIIDRLMDVAMLGVFATLASALLVWFYGLAVIPLEYLVVGLLVFAGASFFMLKESYVSALLRPLHSAFVPERMKARISSAFKGFYAAVRASKENRVHLLVAALVTGLFWVGQVLFAYGIAMSIGIQIPFYYMFLIYPVLSLADLIPISVSGIGTREAILVILFSFIGLTKEQAVAFSLMIFTISYVLVALAGYVFYLSEPVNVSAVLGETEEGA